MIDSLACKYKIKETNIDKIYNYYLALKYNEEYEKRVDNTFIQIVEMFVQMYPNVRIAPPQGREKSKRSIKKKVENLEIERLCKLYAIEGLTKEEEIELFSIITKRTKGKAKSEIKAIAIGEIKDLKPINKIVENKEIEEKIKTALLRIIKIRIENGNAVNKEELLEELENKYGQTAAKNTNRLENDLLHWDSIEKTKEDEKSTKKLHNPFEYIKVKDIRGFEIIIANVPSDTQTDNKTLKQLLNKREETLETEKLRYDDLCCTTQANDFALKLMENETLLEKLNIQLLSDGYKHKEKQNGYLAEHIKFCYRDHPEYTFEIQIRSIYREDLTKANGEAAHDKRSGKTRTLPSLISRKSFIEEIKNVVPNYRILKRTENRFKLHKCTMPENILEYYLGFVDDDINSKEYKKVMQYIKEEESSYVH